jgi:hypothetical protein
MDALFILRYNIFLYKWHFFEALFSHGILETNYMALVLLLPQNSYVPDDVFIDSRFHPFYRPRRPLGRVQVQRYSVL